MMQSIPDSGSSNGVERVERSSPSKSTNDALVESTLDALQEIGGPGEDRPTRREKPAKRDSPDAPEPDSEEEQEVPAEGDADAEEEGDEATHDDEPEEHERGSRAEPFSVKDLPEDRFIKLKIDGEDAVVSFKELAEGHIRQKTFDQRITRTKQLADEAQAHLTHLNETREQLRAATREFLYDPEQLYEYFTENEEREAVVMRLAQRLAAQVREHRENPHARIEYERQRNEKKLRAEQERWQQQKQAEAQAAAQREAQERFERVFKPGWNTGLKRAGFPDTSGPQGQALWDEVMLRLDQRHKSGRSIDPDIVAEFVHRAARLLELPPKNAKKPKPAPAPSPKDRTASAPRGRDPWKDKPRSKKLADPEFFLRNLRPRDFR